MRATKFLFFICFLAVTGKSHAYLYNLIQKYLPGSDSSDDESDRSEAENYDDDLAPHPVGRGLADILYDGVTGFYNILTSTDNRGNNFSNSDEDINDKEVKTVLDGSERFTYSEVVQTGPVDVKDNIKGIPVAKKVPDTVIQAENVVPFEGEIATKLSDSDDEDKSGQKNLTGNKVENSETSVGISTDNLEAQSSTNEEEHEKILTISTATSETYENILKLLKDSYMGDFDFGNVKPVIPQVKLENYNDKLFDDYLGELWIRKNWHDLNNEKEHMKQIKEKLIHLAPITMKHFPSLAPKRTYELEVLEHWLIVGLLTVYPTLTNGVTKDDAIALIILAVVHKAFDKPEYKEIIAHLFAELIKYNGTLSDKFPLDRIWGLIKTEKSQEEIMEKMSEIINERNLPYASKVIEGINNK